jgi:hypothetical protein
MGLKDALKAAHRALLKTWGNSTAGAEQEHDKTTLNQQIFEHNVQKVPNASQVVIVYCACLVLSSSPYISSLPSPPPVYPLPFTLHTHNQWKVSLLSHPIISLALSLLLIFQNRQDARLHQMTREKRVCVYVCVCVCVCREQLWLSSSSQLPWSSVTSTGYPTRSPLFYFILFFLFFASSFLFFA